MRRGRPKLASKEARDRMALPSCEKCRNLTTESGVTACVLGHRVALCADFHDASRQPPRAEGGITRIYVYPR